MCARNAFVERHTISLVELHSACFQSLAKGSKVLYFKSDVVQGSALRGQRSFRVIWPERGGIETEPGSRKQGSRSSIRKWLGSEQLGVPCLGGRNGCLVRHVHVNMIARNRREILLALQIGNARKVLAAPLVALDHIVQNFNLQVIRRVDVALTLPHPRSPGFQ